VIGALFFLANPASHEAVTLVLFFLSTKLAVTGCFFTNHNHKSQQDSTPYLNAPLAK